MQQDLYMSGMQRLPFLLVVLSNHKCTNLISLQNHNQLAYHPNKLGSEPQVISIHELNIWAKELETWVVWPVFQGSCSLIQVKCSNQYYGINNSTLFSWQIWNPILYNVLTDRLSGTRNKLLDGLHFCCITCSFHVPLMSVWNSHITNISLLFIYNIYHKSHNSFESYGQHMYSCCSISGVSWER